MTSDVWGSILKDENFGPDHWFNPLAYDFYIRSEGKLSLEECKILANEYLDAMAKYEEENKEAILTAKEKEKSLEYFNKWKKFYKLATPGLYVIKKGVQNENA